MITQYSDEYWMNITLEQAQLAFRENEVPIGALLVKDNNVIAANHNRTNQQNDPLAHAEKLVVEEVISNGEKFLHDYTLFVTVEPCLMCTGNIIWSRVGKVVFGCYDPKAGAVGSIYNALQDKSFNHNPEVVSGVLAEECSELITLFFKEKRI
jgi:tRNA(adenine34) deaminase